MFVKNYGLPIIKSAMNKWFKSPVEVQLVIDVQSIIEDRTNINVQPTIKVQTPVEQTLSLIPTKRIALAIKQDWQCYWCCQEMVETIQPIRYQNSATVEHLIPRCFGGSNQFDNTVAACYRCNNLRGHEPQDIFFEIAKNLPIDTRDSREVLNQIRIPRTCNGMSNRMSIEYDNTARMRYREDAKAAKAAFLAGIPNPFEMGSRPWRLYALSAKKGHPDPEHTVKEEWGKFDQTEFNYDELEFWVLIILGAKLRHLAMQMKAPVNST